MICMICVCFVSWDLCDLHDLFDVYRTYLCDLQFQVDFMHNISIAAEKDIEV